jgi:hypothetical protein
MEDYIPQFVPAHLRHHIDYFFDIYDVEEKRIGIRSARGQESARRPYTQKRRRLAVFGFQAALALGSDRAVSIASIISPRRGASTPQGMFLILGDRADELLRHEAPAVCLRFVHLRLRRVRWRKASSCPTDSGATKSGAAVVI